ncbi:MAG: hypothetical protein WCK83_15225 [Burkholderiales bacterium]
MPVSNAGIVQVVPADYANPAHAAALVELLDAHALYRRVGFANYELDPDMGCAEFLQKWLD